uniref:Ovule protein n=1 Tax=Ascaris lumbricoides TaxID=6252 RepID=A0A0M3HLM8_ASCLU
MKRCITYRQRSDHIITFTCRDRITTIYPHPRHFISPYLSENTRKTQLFPHSLCKN